MLIKNANIFTGGNFVAGDISFSDKIEKIGKSDGDGIDAQGGYVIPGLVDIHTHGAMGDDFSDGDVDGMARLGSFYVSHGVTTFLATTMTLGEQTLLRAMKAIRSYDGSGAKCGGVHLEGPFLSYAKRGAQAAKDLHKPDEKMFDRLNDASGNSIRLVTVAPEEDGAMEFIEKVSRRTTVSIGHTCADYQTAMAAFSAGATHVTHLFNAMPPMLHRAPGVVGAALDSGASVELICDGLHIHQSVLRAARKLFGDKINIVSDSLRHTGMPDGEYELGGQPITVKNGKATLHDGTLAGSSVTLMDELRNAVEFGFSLQEAVYACSTAPAKAVGLDAGIIEVGRNADLVLLDKDLGIKAVYVDGKEQKIAKR